MSNPGSKMLHTYKSKCEILRNYNSLLSRQSSHFVCTHKCNFSVLFHVKILVLYIIILCLSIMPQKIVWKPWEAREPREAYKMFSKTDITSW